MVAPTKRQKQFLRALGHKSFDGLTKDRASTLIDELLQAEKASGKTFPCPYCKKRFGPRPKRTKKCPSCKETIVHLSGKFYTQEKVEELNQKEWLQDTRKDTRADVRDDWREERSSRKEFGEVHTVGYVIKAGAECIGAQHLNGLLVLIEDANDTPDLLPPFDECNYDTCECEYDAVSPNEVPKGAKVAEWNDPAQQAKLKTRKSSPVAVKSTQSQTGCATTILFCIILFSAGRWLETAM
jgi:hypothetical protein